MAIKKKISMIKYQYYDTGDDSDRDAYGVNWEGQTFTPESDHLIAKVKLKLFRVGSPGTLQVSIRATSAGVPVGGDLASGSIDADTLTTDTNGEWYEITLGDGYEVESSTQYAIIIRATGGDASNKVSLRADITSATYSGGKHIDSTDSGTNWNTYSGVDLLFEIWGTGAPSPTTVTWGNLLKSQISSEKIEEAITRMIQDHEDDSDAHLETGESLQSHKASAIIDHAVESIVEDKINDDEISAPKLKVASKLGDCVVSPQDGDYTSLKDAVIAGEKTIYIKDGTYSITEDIYLRDDTTIIGESGNKTILDFGSQNKNIRIQIPEKFNYAGNIDGELHKIDMAGNLEWTYTGPATYLTSLAVDQERNVYAGFDNGEIHKVDPDGNNVWTYTGFNDTVYGLAVDPDGYIYAGGQEGELHKISSTGNHVWTYDNLSYVINDLAVDADGYSYICTDNSQTHKVDPDGARVWLYTNSGWGVWTIDVDASGNVYIGDTNNEVQKINSSGNNVWTYTGMTDWMDNVRVDASGNVFATSSSDGLHKINSSGTFVWSYTAHTAVIAGLAVTPDGTSFSGSGNNEYEVHKVDPDGNFEWAYSDTTTINRTEVLSYPNYDSDFEEGWREKIHIENLTMKNSNAYPILGEKVDQVEIKKCIFIDNNDGDIKFGDTGSPSLYNVKRVKITNNKFQNQLDGSGNAETGESIQIGTGDGGNKRPIEIRNNYFIDTHRTAIDVTDWNGEFWSHIEDNTIIYTQRQVIGTAILTGIGTVEGNIIQHAYDAMINSGGVVNANLIKHCHNLGLWSYNDISPIICTNNRIEGTLASVGGTEEVGVYIYDGENAIISNNVIIGGDQPSSLQTGIKLVNGVPRSAINGNVIKDVTTGIDISAGSNYCTVTANVIENTTTPINDNGTGNIVANNST